jgi:orotate phosphoribosyltransferase-like protein
VKEKASYRKIKAIGGHFMSRKYTHMKAIEKEIFEMKVNGKTRREIAEHFKLTVKQVENLITRHNNAAKRLEAGIIPRQRGRQPKGFVVSEQEKDYEIKRLKMENELLRDFLRHAGRR